MTAANCYGFRQSPHPGGHRPPLQAENLQTPAKRRMKAFDESRPALAAQAGLILLIVGEVDCASDGHRPTRQQPRRAQPNRYPDFGHDLAPAFPLAVCGKQWLVGARSPLQWRNRPRFSRGSLSLDCDFRWTTGPSFSKNVTFVRPRTGFAKLKLSRQKKFSPRRDFFRWPGNAETRLTPPSKKLSFSA